MELRLAIVPERSESEPITFEEYKILSEKALVLLSEKFVSGEDLGNPSRRIIPYLAVMEEFDHIIKRDNDFSRFTIRYDGCNQTKPWSDEGGRIITRWIAAGLVETSGLLGNPLYLTEKGEKELPGLIKKYSL